MRRRTCEPTKQKQPAAQFIDWAIDPCTETTDQQHQWTSHIQADAQMDWGNTEQRTLCTLPPIISQHVPPPFALTVWVCHSVRYSASPCLHLAATFLCVLLTWWSWRLIHKLNLDGLSGIYLSWNRLTNRCRKQALPLASTGTSYSARLHLCR